MDLGYSRACRTATSEMARFKMRVDIGTIPRYDAFLLYDRDGANTIGALTRPMTVAVSDTHAYLGDRISRRVVKAKLAYATEETCEIA